MLQAYFRVFWRFCDFNKRKINGEICRDIFCPN